MASPLVLQATDACGTTNGCPSGGTCSAVPQPEPLALLIGPAGVRALGIDASRWIEEVGGTAVGSPRLPGALLPLGSVDGGGWPRLNEVLDTLDHDKLAALLALAPHVRAQLRNEGGRT